MLKLHFQLILLLLTIVYMVTIWLQSSYFNPDDLFTYSDYLQYELIVAIGISLELFHFIEFGILYGLIFVLFRSFFKNHTRIEIWSMIFAVSYAFIDEIHQHFVVFRSFSIGDLIKDILGIIFMWSLFRFIESKNKSS